MIRNMSSLTPTASHAQLLAEGYLSRVVHDEPLTLVMFEVEPGLLSLGLHEQPAPPSMAATVNV